MTPALAFALVAFVPPQGHDLQADVELCFSIAEEAKAAAKIAELAASCAAEPEKLLKAITTPPPRSREPKFQLSVPFEGIAYPVTVIAPKKAGDAPPAVILDASFSNASRFPFETPALCWVDQYTPEQFSDASRDSWRKFLHAVSFAVGGDPDRFWMLGFSWGGHAGFDVAEHRPGLLRGVVSLAGGPRRNHFRILPNLAAGARILAYAGAKDDAEMVFNLHEVGRLAKSLKIDYKLTLDPAQGHALPLQGMEEIVALIDAATGTPPAPLNSGVLLADGDKVALPWLEIVEADHALVDLPAQIGVSSSLSLDEQRRATIHAMADHVAFLGWKATPAKGGGVALALTGKGVKKAAIYVKAPWFDPTRELTVTANGKRVFSGPLKLDPAAVLTEARRTGDRQRPTLMVIPVGFPK
jgi:predicted esterase